MQSKFGKCRHYEAELDMLQWRGWADCGQPWLAIRAGLIFLGRPASQCLQACGTMVKLSKSTKLQKYKCTRLHAYKKHRTAVKRVWIKEGYLAPATISSDRAKMKEFTKFAVPRSFLPELQISFLLHAKWSRGHILTVFWKILNRGTPRKSGFFQERGRKRVKEWGHVTFMKEWVKALDNMRILAPADLKNLVSFPRYGHLKIPKGPNQISLYRF